MNWKEKLKTLREQWYLKKYAAARDFCVPLARPYSDNNTNDLTRSICDYLKFSGHYANRVNTTGRVRLETVQLAGGRSFKKANWTRGNTNKGAADISAVIAGKAVSIEVKCKATKDTIKPSQIKERSRIEDAGGIYYVATDMQSFTEWFEQKFSTITFIKN